MNKINYQKKLDEITSDIVSKRASDPDFASPRLLLHACCAPCSSYCLEYLREYFDITVCYYNPNISSAEEYARRFDEEKRLIDIYNRQVTEYRDKGRTEFEAGMKVSSHTGIIGIMEADYDPDAFYEASRGLEDAPERGARCGNCFSLRIGRTYEYASGLGGFDYISTTLTLSPLKDEQVINETGIRICGDSWLPCDFKKRNGYLRSLELSEAFTLYRQNYCGCVYSVRK